MTARTDRIETLARALGKPAAGGSDHAEQEVLDLLDVADHRQIWLALAVLTGRLPDERTVIETARAAQLDPDALLRAAHTLTPPGGEDRAVVVAGDRVVVDVPDMASTSRRGRMAGELAEIWEREHDALLVTWDDDAQALVAVTSPTTEEPADGRPAVVVPWRSRYILPFSDGSAARVARLRTLARCSGNVVGALDAGLSAVTMAEEFPSDQTAATAAMLTVLRHADRIAAVSQAARIEYDGWSQTLGAIGLTGPEVVVVPPAPLRPARSDQEVVAWLRVGVLPLVAVLASHASPRLQSTVLRAAERLWCTGHRFALTVLTEEAGGEPEVARLVAELQRRDRPVALLTQAAPELERAALEHACLAVSLAPAATAVLDWSAALDVATPAIVRSAGPRLDASLPAGCLPVDLHDEDAVHDVVGRLLADGETLETLTADATRSPAPSLDGFASEVWHALRCDEPIALPRRTTPPAGPGGDHHQDDVGNDHGGNNNP